MEQINESLVNDYFVKFGKFVIKWVHHPCYSFWGVGGKTYLWANHEKGWVEKKLIQIMTMLNTLQKSKP